MWLHEHEALMHKTWDVTWTLCDGVSKVNAGMARGCSSAGRSDLSISS